MTLSSDNVIVRTTTNLCLNYTLSIIGGNWRYLRPKYGMKECNVIKRWDEKCKNVCEYVALCEQIREMCSWRDK